MNHWIRKTTAASAIGVALLLLVVACGGRKTVASRSAEAFREAQKNGTAQGGASHGGHSPATADRSTATDSTGEHATMTGMDHSTMAAGPGAMAGMDHSNMPGMQRGQSMAGMDHSKMKPGQSMAGMDHSRMKPGEPMAGMDHSKMQSAEQPMAGMDHSRMPGVQQSSPALAVKPPTTTAEVQRLRPASTLQVDEFDAPAASAVSEAMKASQGGGHEGMEIRGITPGQDRENPPTSAPAFRDGPMQGVTAPATNHSGHGTAPAASAAATVYTCPMHPEVTSDKPGTCPKCGMALVKKK